VVPQYGTSVSVKREKGFDLVSRLSDVDGARALASWHGEAVVCSGADGRAMRERSEVAATVVLWLVGSKAVNIAIGSGKYV
jgi:hypothetical protein